MRNIMETSKRVILIMLSVLFALSAACTAAELGQTMQNAEQFVLDNETTLYDYKPNESTRYLIDYGIIDANKYAAFRYVTRDVAVQIIADVTGLSTDAKGSDYTHPFVDLSNDTEQLIAYLYRNNIIEGVTHNRYMGDEVCDRVTFLCYLLRALNAIGGGQENILRYNAMKTAMEKGLLHGTKEIDDGIISLSEAFDICYNALFTYIDDSHQTLLSYLYSRGIASVSDGFNHDIAYEIRGTEATPFFQEQYDDKVFISGDRVIGTDGDIYWYGSNAKGASNRITADGYLQLSGKDQNLVTDQQIALRKDHMQGHESYGMNFTVNVQSMANEGDEGRAIFRVIPRSADEDFTKYYSVNYYMTFPLGHYQSNLARCKWSITNTNAPSGTKPLVEAYYLLREGIDYTARLLIENTADGNVHLAFYIDGPDHYSASTEPLLEYTDDSQYKIMQSATGPAFGSSGYLSAGWGFASTVNFDNVELYDTRSFAAQTAQFSTYAQTPVNLKQSDAYASQLRYLIYHGTLMPWYRNMDFGGHVSIAQFLATAMYLNGVHMREGQTLDEFVDDAYQLLFKGKGALRQTGRAITRYEAAVIIEHMMPGEAGSDKYDSLYSDTLDTAYQSAVYFAVQNSYLLLDENNCFNGEKTLTRYDVLRIFACAIDADLRDRNHDLWLPAIFSNDAILQGGKQIPVSGRGMSGDTVTVTFNGQIRTAKVVNGRWALELDSQAYGGPYTLTVKDSGYTLSFKGIYVGEVFVVAGQSNAEMSVYESDDNTDTLKKFNNQTQVRLFRPASRMATRPMPDRATKWEVARDQYSEQVVGTATAIGVFCVQELLEINPVLKDVKIGIIQLTYGGTSIEMFLPDSVNDKNGKVQADNEFLASGFWNGYMDGLTPYAAKALIYYQGENSAQLGYMYEPMLRDYIWGVRQEFYDNSLPVLLVQLAGYGDNYGQDNDLWPYIREVQMRVANTTDNVGLVTAIDLSDKNPQEIHPTSKRPIGKRLAYLAMKLVYGKDYGWESPWLTRIELNGKMYSLCFGTGPVIINDDVYGNTAFEVLDTRGNWVDAQARVEHGVLRVWNNSVLSPQGVRYAWANYPKACLFNRDGLPVLPFNTTKDLETAVATDSFMTTANRLKKAYHLLNTGDMVINLTRNSAARHVNVVNAYVVEYMGGNIEGQSSGDQIVLLSRKDNFVSESGTTSTLVKLTAHSLKSGDWIYNTEYGVLTEVLEVIDVNTVRVSPVAGQSCGDIFEVYKNAGIVFAEK